MYFPMKYLLKKQNQLLTASSIQYRNYRRGLERPPGVPKTLEEKLKGKLITNIYYKSIK